MMKTPEGVFYHEQAHQKSQIAMMTSRNLSFMHISGVPALQALASFFHPLIIKDHDEAGD